MKNSLSFTALLIFTSAFVAAFTTSCGTVRGFGRDVETVGDGIERAAR